MYPQPIDQTTNQPTNKPINQPTVRDKLSLAGTLKIQIYAREITAIRNHGLGASHVFIDLKIVPISIGLEAQGAHDVVAQEAQGALATHGMHFAHGAQVSHRAQEVAVLAWGIEPELVDEFTEEDAEKNYENN